MTRNFRIAAACGVALAMLVLTADVARAQRRGNTGGARGGGGFQRGGFGQQSDPLSLLNNRSVQQALEIEDSQTADIQKLRQEMDDAVTAARQEIAAKYAEKLGGILLPQQLDRLNQISVQQKGIAALDDPQIAAKLGITESQKRQFAAKRQEQEQKMTALREELRNAPQGGDRTAMFQKFGELRQENQDAMLSVLTASQKKQFEAMKGEAFEMQRGFGGGTRPGGTRPGGTRPGGNNQQQGNNRTRRPNA